MISRFLLSFFSIVLLASCASSDKRDPNAPPDWIYGKSAQYPSNQYIIGNGSADNLALAKDRARADLAKVFNVKISEKLRDQQSAEFDWTQSRNPKEYGKIERALQSTTQQTLSSVTIPETWHNKSTRQFHALAVISRMQLSNYLRGQIAELDNATHQMIIQSNKTDTKFRKIKLASEAIRLQEKRSIMQSQLQVADLSGMGISPRWTVSELRSHRLQLMGDLRLGTSVEGDHIHEIRSAIDSILTKNGFNLTNLGQLSIKASLKSQSLGNKNGWEWITGFLQVTLIENNHRIVGEKSWHLKTSASDPQLAETRLIQKAEATLQSELMPSFFEFFE